MCTWLERDFDEEECLLAIKSLGQNKAPGPDGFPVSFYLLCWDILKEDFMKVLQDLQERSFLDWRLKNTFIALIPKKDTIEEIKDLRPISLVHGSYKILSKLLAERFKVSLPSVISQHQTTFIKKRQILDGVLISNELIDSRTRSAKPGLLCKLDFETAFDHVNWDFIDEILKLMGYGDKWRSWVKCCVEFVKFSVLVNGSASGFFTNANIEQVKNLRLILLSFELLTGLKINFSKSQIFGVGFDGDLSQFCDILGCYSCMLPTIYLGLPLGDNCIGVDKWDKIVDKFIAKLVGWKKKLLKRAETIMRNFLWHDNVGRRKIHLVKWDAICIKKKHGGLGVKNLKIMNQALLCKWSWRFAKEEDAMWRKIVAEKYGTGDVQWMAKVPNCSYGSSVWRAIMNHNSFFLKHVRFKVHSGSLLRFWKDNWLYDTPIKDCYPHLYNVSRSKNHKVDEMGVTEENGVVWNLRSPRRLFGAAAMEHAILVSDLASFTFTPDLGDELQWNLCASKVYSVKSLYDFLSVIDADTAEKPVFSFIWKQKYPPKIGFFLRTIAHGRLPTKDSLRRKRMDVPVDYAVYSWHLKQSSKALTYLWNLIPAAVLWCIWKERNARVFTDKVCNEVDVTNKAIYCLYTWSSVIKEFEHLSSTDVMENWHNSFFESY
ncbi:uncharacterized protein LOC113350786 [Papaver somniferum]|uniref:uncharacterized protein LOC113350786 n=1 Tax=Papaver somniferum TaxID=3469 RepID=UPI000E702E93|nr:uncharacterized protein LOC113350786 [Papaver somniferum]